MAEKHLVLVCHTETWWQSGSWDFFDEVFEGFRRAWDAAANGAKRPRATFCLTAEAVEDHAAFFAKVQEEGHELGVHSHLPGSQRGGHSYAGEYAYHVDENGVLNQDSAAATVRSMVIEAGLGTPRVHVSGMFTFRDTTASVLEEAGLTVDCSLLPGELGRHPVTGDFVLSDNRGRTCPAPYCLSRSDHCTSGDSSVIELPCWGHLNGRDDQQCLIEIAAESLRSGKTMAELWEAYWRDRGALEGIPSSGHHIEGRHEVAQLFFHYWDFVAPDGGANGDDLDCLGRFLSQWRELDGCDFATAGEAADAWMRADEQ